MEFSTVWAYGRPFPALRPDSPQRVDYECHSPSRLVPRQHRQRSTLLGWTAVDTHTAPASRGPHDDNQPRYTPAAGVSASGATQANWFSRHKVLSGIAAFVLVVTAVGAFAAPETTRIPQLPTPQRMQLTIQAQTRRPSPSPTPKTLMATGQPTKPTSTLRTPKSRPRTTSTQIGTAFPTIKTSVQRTVRSKLGMTWTRMTMAYQTTRRLPAKRSVQQRQ